jgi:hypothetical protein
MTKDKEDGSITASRNDYAQSKCHCALGRHRVTYILRELWFIVLLFQENKSFGASCHLHSSSDVREAMSGTVIICSLNLYFFFYSGVLFIQLCEVAFPFHIISYLTHCWHPRCSMNVVCASCLVWPGTPRSPTRWSSSAPSSPCRFLSHITAIMVDHYLNKPLCMLLWCLRLTCCGLT